MNFFETFLSFESKWKQFKKKQIIWLIPIELNRFDDSAYKGVNWETICCIDDSFSKTFKWWFSKTIAERRWILFGPIKDK